MVTIFTRFERIMILIALISLSLYGINVLNGDITTAATTEFNNVESQIEIPEGYIQKKLIEGFEYPYVNGQNPLKSTLNSFEKRGYSKSSIDNSITNKIYPAEVNYVIRDS